MHFKIGVLHFGESITNSSNTLCKHLTIMGFLDNIVNKIDSFVNDLVGDDTDKTVNTEEVEVSESMIRRLQMKQQTERPTQSATTPQTRSTVQPHASFAPSAPPVPQNQEVRVQASQPKVSPSTQQDDNDEQIYDSKLENLINMALADGVLTEKEKQVLFRKAQASGIDLDEFEMVLEAKLYKRKQEQKDKEHAQAVALAQTQAAIHHQTAPAAQQKHAKYGDVNKCPGCGAMIETYSTHCPQCGFTFSNVEASATFTKLMRELDSVEANRKSLTMKEMMMGITDRTDDRKKSIISNFPIPTTKADILEFVTMGAPLAQKKGNFFTANHPDNAAHNALVGAWQDKLKQVVIKARLSMKEDKATIAEIENIVREAGVKI